MLTPGSVILGIETSNPTAADPDDPASNGPGVALGRIIEGGDAEVLDAEPLRPTGRHDDDLMPAIDRLTKRAGVSARELAAIAVSVGPGGYTGLRVAVTTANTLALSTGARALAVPTAAAANLSVPSESPWPVAVCLASKRGRAHVTCFSRGGTAGLQHNPGRAVGVIGAAELGALKPGTVVGDDHLPESFRDTARGLGARVERTRLSAGSVVRLCPYINMVETRMILPIYAREPEAVRRWRERPVK